MSATEANIKAKANSEIVIVDDCSCGKVHQCSGVTHYGRYVLKCGRAVWALQPRRNGPLVLRDWPGQPLTRRELEEREKSEKPV